ncbi:uncharacterized protein K02A2.6-like [Hydractinia symbiolongicarpus]|uniref:uncharacterized protein K02A2.6-like n=1 Tax=Hydractinia symbiolongicarpus TaxID=13093 RepID=UPI00254F7042|nr:uncharacterized protein K02A2.6-like [Hydractinia symbiolongicarpus]
MDSPVAQEIDCCIPCQAVSKKTRYVPLQSTQIPPKVWQTINMDYLGPFPDGKYALAMIDQRSRYPLVSITPSTSAKNLISILNTAFTKFGYPETIITDNGPLFWSNEIKQYMKINKRDQT